MVVKAEACEGTEDAHVQVASEIGMQGERSAGCQELGALFAFFRNLDGVEGIEARAEPATSAGELAEVENVRGGPTIARARQEVENLVEAVDVFQHVIGEFSDGGHDDVLLVRGDARPG